MRDLISDFNSMKAIPNSIPTPIPIQMMAIPIQFQFRLDWVKPIPELDLELASKSNSGAELTPTRALFNSCVSVVFTLNVSSMEHLIHR